MSYDPRQNGALCSQCPLRGKKVVAPVGPADPDLVICGDAPGPQEEKQGKPFVGPSGTLLTDMLKNEGMVRSRVWITNAILCRPDVPGISGSKRFDVKTYLAWLRLQNRTVRKLGRAEWKALPSADRIPFETWIADRLLSNPFDCCAPRLKRELVYFDLIATYRKDPNGIVVVPMGGFASKAITGKSVGILKLRGSPIPVRLD